MKIFFLIVKDELSSYYISALNDNKQNENDNKNELDAESDPNANENQKSAAADAGKLDENNNNEIDNNNLNTIDMESQQNLNEILTEVQNLTDGSQLEKITTGNKILTQQSVEDKIVRSSSSSSKLRNFGKIFFSLLIF